MEGALRGASPRTREGRPPKLQWIVVSGMFCWCGLRGTCRLSMRRPSFPARGMTTRSTAPAMVIRLWWTRVLLLWPSRNGNGNTFLSAKGREEGQGQLQNVNGNFFWPGWRLFVQPVYDHRHLENSQPPVCRYADHRKSSCRRRHLACLGLRAGVLAAISAGSMDRWTSAGRRAMWGRAGGAYKFRCTYELMRSGQGWPRAAGQSIQIGEVSQFCRNRPSQVVVVEV